MTAPYECEVRFPVDDIEAFHRRLRAIGATVTLEYAFTDHYYHPAHGMWDPRERALRIRDHQVPPQDAEVLLTRVEIAQTAGLPFKRSRFAEGKVRLYAGRLEDCRRVVESLGFVPWIAVPKRAGRLVEIPEFGELVTEHVEGVGWMCEVEEEGTDTAAAVAAIRAKLARLGIDVGRVTGDPVAAIVAQHLEASHGA